MNDPKPEWLADILRDWLKREMSGISEDYMAAGWLNTLEYILWQAVLRHPEPVRLGFSAINLQRIERIKAVSEYLGEWMVWRREGGIVPIPLDEWRAMFAKYKENK